MNSDLEVFVKGQRTKQEDLQGKATEFVTALEEDQKRANEILGFAAAANVAQAYLEEAKAQKEEADKWRLIALGIIAALAIVAFVSFVLLKPDADFTTADYIRYALVRLPVFLVLGPSVPWVLKQSAEHRERERFARLRGQELTSFRPFLAELSDDERRVVIKEASARFFTGDSRHA